MDERKINSLVINYVKPQFGSSNEFLLSCKIISISY